MTSSAEVTAATAATQRAEKPQPIPSRRRDKPQLSCNLCRRRKLKCDRGHPCDSCARRGLSLSCVYVDSSTTGQTPPGRILKKSTLQERIEQLEKLVMVFAASKNTAKPSIQQISSEIPDDRAVDSSLVSHLQSLSENLGRINLDNEEPNYVESTHWTAILDGISELKDSLNEKVEPENVPKTIANIQETSRPTLLCPEEYTISKHDILAAIPPKAVVDSLVATCFTHAEILYVLLHAPTFQKQYESFWKQPQSTPIMWMAILYGLMCMGTHYEFFSVLASEKIAAGILPIESQNQVEMFRRKMIQCIVLGGYTKGVPHTIETLLLYLHVEFLGKPDSPTEFWLLLGILVRLAYRLGYHRDGSQFPSITPFEAEMRRRRWCSIVQMETMASTQFGLPKMIKESQSDVAPPHNLFDEDFDESTTKLPESRPITTVTPSLYLITKTNLFSIFGRISELTLQTTQAPYAEVMTLDKALDDFQKNMPPSFKMRSMTQSITDRPELIFQRIWIALLHLKCKCVLHRRYLRVGRLDKRCTYSRITCIDSALQMLSLQNMLYGESLPNGRLFQEYWRYSSMLKQEYLLAVAILCVDVYTDLELEDSPTNPKYPVDKQSRYRILDAMRIALSIWEQEGGESLEAKKAQSALQLVLDKAKNTDASRRSRQDGSSLSPHISHEADSFSFGTGFSSSPVSNFLTPEAADAPEWQPFNPFPPLPHDQWDNVKYATPLVQSIDFSAFENDLSQPELQAQDLMDILQEDYPGMIL